MQMLSRGRAGGLLRTRAPRRVSKRRKGKGAYRRWRLSRQKLRGPEEAERARCWREELPPRNTLFDKAVLQRWGGEHSPTNKSQGGSSSLDLSCRKS